MANHLPVITDLARRGLRLALSVAGLMVVSAAHLFAASFSVPDSSAEFRADGGQVIPRAASDMKGAAASDDVRLVADWIVRNDKQRGHPFIIADKVNGLVFAFHENGELLAKSRALYGAVRSDAMTQEQADKTWDEIVASDKITPAGIFPARGYRSPAYGASIRFAEFANSNLLIHRAPVEWRRKKLQSSGQGKVHVTYGCINVLPEFMDNVLLPVFSGESTIFILPEMQSPRSFFAIDDVPYTPLRTARK